MNGVHQWLLYRSMSLFCPPKSSLYKLYGHLSDPVRIFGISSKISNHLIPLSEASLNARMLIEAKLDGLPKKVDKWSREVIDYEAEFREPDVRNGIVTCAALSRDGRYIALGLGSGIIEIADIDDQRTISQFQNDPPNPPAWIEFNHGHHRVTTEDVNGNIAIYSHGVLPVKLGTLPIGAYPVVTAVSDSGFFIIRVLRDPGKPWYNNVARIYILGDRHIQLLASPPLDSSIPSSQPSKPAFPERHTIAFSPGARYIAAFDGYNAFTWSTESGDFITHYDIRGDKSWIINPGMAPTCPYHIPHPVSTRPTLPLAGDTISAHHSWVDARPDSDESWIKRPFFHPLPKHGRGYSFAAGKTPLVNAFYIPQSVWFNGGPQLTVPREYYVSVGANSTNGIQRWYGDQLINNINNFYRPQSSKDGTRFLLQGQMKAPIVVDIGQAAWYPSATFDFPVPNSYSPCSTASDISSPHETSDSP
ncbi:uncharacterized protein EI90DRAFT_1620135 [Cantharellus anzutake]|uniref:uncharacterized protein n=1 Tax=Cantharellus anzutake TaxID=1750568 RepID=UPI0019042DB8|nr:uncharacterized protein EI90DRAFT_1620135 [Cantharellus anzutake]KAF8328252.1 hypothetical protein EI90DRAFT_1620135 [Cantharellus anzutake]